MASINIYENSNGELDLTEIQNTLNKILKESENLNNRLSKIEDKLKYLNKIDVKKNKETITKALKEIETDVSDKRKKTNIKVDKETELDYTKFKLTDFQLKLLNEIPIVDNPQEYEKQMMETFKLMKPSERKGFINKQCTIKSLTKKFNVSRNTIIGNIFTNRKPRYGLFHAFKINPHNMKSSLILYRERAVPKVKGSVRKSRSRKKDGSAKWELRTESAKENYHNLRLKPHFGLKYDSRDGKRTYDLYYDMFDIFYIKSLLASKFTYNDFDELLNSNKHNWTVKNLSQIIYNIENNLDLQKLIVDTRKFFNTGNTFSENNGILRINDVNTHIRVEQARDWCVAYMNNGKSKDAFAWNLQRRFPEIKREFITMIIYNHNNEELYDLWKEEEKPIVYENNPSKRKNLILNGGVL